MQVMNQLWNFSLEHKEFELWQTAFYGRIELGSRNSNNAQKSTILLMNRANTECLISNQPFVLISNIFRSRRSGFFILLDHFNSRYLRYVSSPTDGYSPWRQRSKTKDEYFMWTQQFYVKSVKNCSNAVKIHVLVVDSSSSGFFE